MSIKKIFIIIALCFCGFLAHFLIMVYPDDSRIIQDTNLTGPIEDSSIEALPGLWPKSWMQPQLDPDVYASFIKELAKDLPHHLAKTADPSKRYLSNYSVGNYPERLENRPGILIKSGSSLLLKPKLKGKFRLSLGAIAVVAKSKLTIKVLSQEAESTVQSFSLRAPATPPDSQSAFNKNFKQYWSVDQDTQYSSWEDHTIDVQLTKKDQIELACQSNKGHCFIARPKFLLKLEQRANNMLVVVIDTLRADAINPTDSPFLYQLKQQGLDFPNTLAVGNMTSPSSNGLLSCQKPSELKSIAFAYGNSRASKRKFYQNKKPSFPKLLQKAGWETAMIGNISVISETLNVGVNHGFSEQIAIERDSYDTPKTLREAKRWLYKHKNRQFFLYTHFHAPHGPYRAPLSDLKNAYRGVSDLSSIGNILKWLYRAEVQLTDRYLAKLFQSLEELKLKDNTNVVITSDHGDHHQNFTFNSNKAGPALTGAYYDHGATLLNDEINIPMIFSGPDFKSKQVYTKYVSNLDIGPTLLQAAGQPTPKWCDGISLLPLIAAETKKATNKENKKKIKKLKKFTEKYSNRIIGSEGMKRRAILFEQRYKYTSTYSPSNKKLAIKDQYIKSKFNLFEDELLVDLKNDPEEATNLIHTNRPLANKARKKFNEYYKTQYLWELVVESPQNAPIKIEFYEPISLIKYEGISPLFASDAENEAKATKLEIDLGSSPQLATEPAPNPQQNPNSVYLMANNQQAILTFDQPLTKEPSITVGADEQRPLPLRKTYAKIKSPLLGSELPAEMIGQHSLMNLGNLANAYYRRVTRTNAAARKIVAGNKNFEKILKQWGYLNDN